MMPKPEGFDVAKYKKADSPGMPAFGFLRRSLESGKVAGKLRVGDVELASQTLWCGVHGVTSLFITHEAFPWVGKERVIHSVVDTLIAGISQEPR